MLKDSGQHDQPATLRPFAQNADIANAEIRLAAGNRFGDVDIRTTLANGNVETGVVIEALLKGCVVTSKLELVLPFELQGDLIKRGGRLQCQPYQTSGHD